MYKMDYTYTYSHTSVTSQCQMKLLNGSYAVLVTIGFQFLVVLHFTLHSVSLLSTGTGDVSSVCVCVCVCALFSKLVCRLDMSECN